jgi:hypothetical protein
MSHENETLRWPTNMDRRAIELRLMWVREEAEKAGLVELAARFVDVEGKTASQIGASVIGAITWIQDKPEHKSLTDQLSMVAMNLKNLK